MSSDDHGFILVSERPVPNLKLSLQHFRHACGADHFHLANDDAHRSFTVSFRTVPDDSTGLPHILEHLVLCGSEKYPVRDPFFMMIRRSLNTFMNAMTGSDTTYYPFASEIEKDFYNLLDIYLDAAFQPNLHPLDFAQEGHRLEPEDAADRDPTAEDWEFKGVVYNEMKGAMGNTDSLLSEETGKTLLPDTPFRHNSGGDPRVIPTLTHADLVAFHANCYNGANACFVTYGDLDTDRLHALFAPYVSERPGTVVPMPEPQAPLPAPEETRFQVPQEAGQDPRDVSVASLSWAFGDTRDFQDWLLGGFLDRLLLGHAGAPLRRALESSGLGRGLGRCGYSPVGYNGTFTVDMKGMDPADYDKFEPLVMGTLSRLADEGFGEDEVAAVLHQFELSRRTIRGDGFPFGLELGMRVSTALKHHIDPLVVLDDQEAAIETLRARVEAPGFLEMTIRELLLDNPHRALLLAEPTPTFNADLDAKEQDRLDARVAELDGPTQETLVEQAAALAERQAIEDDPSILPELLLGDVPAERRWAEGSSPGDGIEVFTAGTNGILHQVAAMPLGGLSADEVLLLPLLADTVGQLGVGDLGYAEQAARLNALCGGLNAWVELHTDRHDLDHVRGLFFLEVRGLARRSGEYVGLTAETLAGQRFDEHARLVEIVEQALTSMQEGVAWRGHLFAQWAASRGFGGRAGLSHGYGGLGRLAALKALAARVKADPTVVPELAEALSALLARLSRAPVRLALIGDTAAEPEKLDQLRATWDGWDRPVAFGEDTRVALPAAEAADPLGFTMPTQVNYAALSFPTVPIEHEDAAALAVAAPYLRNSQLHTRLREKGGAYGGGASYDARSGVLALSSYRDPRLTATYTDMRESLEWLTDAPDDERLEREAILNVIGGLDRPGSPASEARRRFSADMFGHGPEAVNAFRKRVLGVTGADLRRVAKRWLPHDGGSSAAITSVEILDASGLGWGRESI